MNEINGWLDGISIAGKVSNAGADRRSQFVTSKSDKIGLRYNPMAFTEQSVDRLSRFLVVLAKR
jgi:hypothetical protein